MKMTNLNKSQGSILLAVIMFSFILAISVAAFIQYSSSGIIQVKAATHSMKAFYIAEAGLELGIQRMANDFEYTPEGQIPSWADGDLWEPDGVYDVTRDGTIAVPQNYPNFYPLEDVTSYAGGTFIVTISNENDRSDRIWIKSTGQFEGESRTVMARLRIRDISPWNNAIFAGEGTSGKVINGNIDIRGSVHILGTSLAPTDLAAEMSGGGNIGNNYLGMPASLFARVPSIQQDYGGVMVEDLVTEVRIQHGKLALSGTAEVGAADSPGYKGSVAGVYITDGYGGNKGAANVTSDNGTDQPYDLEADPPPFPKLSEAYEAYPTYVDYLEDNALVISNPADLAILADITPGTVFSASSPKGEFILDGTGNMTINGIVVINGPLQFSGGPGDVMEYTGKASILTAGDITVKVDIITKWLDTYPETDLLGFMTLSDIVFDKSQLEVMGLFYAENQIISTKQTSVAGTFFSKYFDMGNNVPAIYQIPEAINYLPPGMIGAERIWTLQKGIWREM